MNNIELLCNEEQAMEIEILSSMFTESELVFSTCSSESVDCSYKILSNFTIRLEVSKRRIDISVQFPKLYPKLEMPIVYLRSDGKFFDKELNTEFRKWLEEQEKGLPLTTEIVCWVQENAEKYVILEGSAKPKCSALPEKFARYYIWSHHIYSNTKRANLVSLGKQYKLTGFSTPGKPAVIIIEGPKTLCESFWADVRNWNWMKIKLVHQDELTSKAECKFAPFKEVLLPSTDNKHVNIGPVKTMLAEAGLEHRFSMLYSL